MHPAQMVALDQIFLQIAFDWKHRTITYAVALQRLCDIGWSVNQAAHWLADN